MVFHFSTIDVTIALMPAEIGNRIIILGCPGSGKSTFARSLHEKTGLPLIHLDNIWWRSDRTHISRDEFDLRLAEILAGDKWIIDGNYSRTYEVRIRACDTVIFLDFSEEQCMAGIIDRIGKDRPDIPWTENTLDPELVELVKNYARDNRPVVYSLLGKSENKRIIIFISRKEMNVWLIELDCQSFTSRS